MATVTEALKDTVLGSSSDSNNDEGLPQLSAQTRSDFLLHAVTDEATGEQYMGEKEFVDAVAPVGEDYVGTVCGSPVIPVMCEVNE